MKDEFHIVTCLKQRGFLINRHDMVVRYLLKRISARKHPNIQSVKKGKIDGMKPDIVFNVDGKEWVLDVAFCKDAVRTESAFQDKIDKY